MNYKETLETIYQMLQPENIEQVKVKDIETLVETTLKENKEYFVITSVHRDDLEYLGFDVSKVGDEIMHKLAEKMADAYCEFGFWESLEALAEDYFELPRKEEEDKE